MRLFELTLIGALTLVTACGSGVSSGPATMPPGDPQNDDVITGQTTVALEVTPGEESGGVRLVAVVTHGDGTTRRADLGAYQGSVAEVPAQPQELIHVTVLDGDRGHRIRLLRTVEGIEAVRRPVGEAASDEERLELIELPEPRGVQPQNPAIEHLDVH